MRVLKNILSQLHSFLLCALLSVIFWGWIFTIITDTTPKKKVTVLVSCYGLENQALTLRLEEHLPDGIKMIKVHDQNYDIMGFGDEQVDVYVLRESELKAALRESTDNVAVIDLPEGFEGYVLEDKVYGIRVFDAETGVGIGRGAYITYQREGDPEAENYYLCFSPASLHLKSLPGAIDNAAWEVAMDFLTIEAN